jgi:hypothetical protein
MKPVNETYLDDENVPCRANTAGFRGITAGDNRSGTQSGEFLWESLTEVLMIFWT